MIRQHPFLTTFVALYMAGFGGYALLNGNKEFIFYGVIMLLCIGLVAWMHARVGLSTLALWLLAIWGGLHMAGGNLPIPDSFMASSPPAEGSAHNVLYNFRPFAWFPKYDQWTHAFGFFAATIASWEAFSWSSKCTLRPTFGILVGMVCIGMGLGAINEVVEFAAVLLIPNTNVGGYMNTGWDLVSNLTGCVLAAAFIAVFWREPRSASPDGDQSSRSAS